MKRMNKIGTTIVVIVLILLTASCGTQKKVTTEANAKADREKAYQQLLRELEDDDFLVQNSITDNPNAPSDVIAKMSKDESSVLRAFASQNSAMPKSILDSILVYDDDLWIRGYALANKQYSADFLDKLMRGNYSALCSDYDSIFCHFDLGELIHKDFIRISFAKNPNTPTWILSEIYIENDSTNNFYIARHRNASPELLQTLSNDQSLSVREAVARNPNTSLATLEQLLNDDDSFVQLGVLLSSTLSPEFIAEVVQNGSDFQKQNISNNPNIELSLLKQLLIDDDQIRWIAASNEKLPQELIVKLSSNTDEYIRRGIALNTQTSDIVLQKLANDNLSEVRRAVAQNTNTPIKILQELANDSVTNVRIAVAGNTNTPSKLLINMAKDNDIEIQKEVMSNSSTPPDVIIALLKKIASSAIDKVYLEGVPNDDYTYFIFNIAENPDMPIEVLQWLAKSKNVWIRSSVAQNKLYKE